MPPADPNLDPSDKNTLTESKLKAFQASPLSRTGAATPSKATAPSAPRAKLLPSSLKSLNPFTVSKHGGAAHPSRPQPEVLRFPPNYKPVARRVTAALVAMPIAIVTSWLLWERCE